MSLFQNRSEFCAPGLHDPDVVHLGSHGCDVLFSRYSRDSDSGPRMNTIATKNLITQGGLVLTLAGVPRFFAAGDWFEIPARTEYSIYFRSDCSMIEFCFDPVAAH
jgi:hypothetical protein